MVGIIHTISNVALIFAVTDGLDKFGFEFRFAHWVFIFQLQPLEIILVLVLLINCTTHAFFTVGHVHIDLGVDLLDALVHAFL